jgi:hypothetical protein
MGNLDTDSFSFAVESENGIDVRKPLFRLLAKEGWPLIGLEAADANLEDVFLTLTEKSTAPRAKKKKKRESVE